MKPKYTRWLSAGLIAISTAAFGAAPVAMSVQVKNGQLRATPSFLGQVVAPLNYCDRLEILEQQGDWSKATTPGGQTGWVHNSALTKKKLAMKAGAQDAQTAASGEEQALAGKGFNKEVEADFKAKNKDIDFTWVDKMETLKVAPETMQKFLKDGGVQPTEGGRL